MKKAFTLAEIMIVLVVIGIISAIIMPIAKQSIPDKNIMKFKKGHNTLFQVISTLVNDNKYYLDGDLGKKSSGENVNSAIYFCNTFSDIVSSKSVNCSNASGSLDSSALLSIESSNPDIGWQNINVDEYIDCMCKKYAPSNPEIITNDNINYYTINPYIHFGSTDDNNERIFKPSKERYKYFCMDVDDLGSGTEPFGYGIRTDGKIILGKRAKAWLDKDIQNDNETDDIAIVNTCSSIEINLALRNDNGIMQNIVANSGNTSGGSGEVGGGSGSGEPEPDEDEEEPEISCNIANCETCSSNDVCSNCREHYTLSANVCISCNVANCLSCSSADNCSTCKTGYNLNSTYKTCTTSGAIAPVNYNNLVKGQMYTDGELTATFVSTTTTGRIFDSDLIYSGTVKLSSDGNKICQVKPALQILTNDFCQAFGFDSGGPSHQNLEDSAVIRERCTGTARYIVCTE